MHNLYRNVWGPMLAYRDNFAQQTPPEDWALEFRQSFQDAVEGNSGPRLRRAVTRLMKHPQYRDAHATDDHFMSAMFVAGAVGDDEDDGTYGQLKAETWELVSPFSVKVRLYFFKTSESSYNRLTSAPFIDRPICATHNMHLAPGPLLLLRIAKFRSSVSFWDGRL